MANDFKKVDNILGYVSEGISNGTFTVDEVAKFARISAVQGEVGQEVVTKMANGLEETRNTVKLDEKTGQPGWIVTNPGGEQYIVEDSVFAKKYELDPENNSQYKPKGGPALATQINEDITFEAPWGGDMNIAAGGYLVLGGKNDIYGIQEQEFNDTYKPTGKSNQQSLEEAKKLLGIEQDKIKVADIQEAVEGVKPGKTMSQLLDNAEKKEKQAGKDEIGDR
ncbi:MAG: hypothetical protein ACM3UU_05310 [Ignavibacteriales bacterium]